MAETNKYITFSDEYAKVDSLIGSKYIDGLTSFIMTCDTPMTLSIQGDWGTGKTTALKLIETQLQNTDANAYQTLWFNTWQYSKFGMENNLPLSLMQSLYRKLGAIAKARNKISDFSSSLKKAVSILGIGFAYAMDAKLGTSSAENISALLADSKINGLQKDTADQLENLKSNIESCIDQLLNENERLIIFIDDLDRLEPRVAFELLECLKIFLDCKRCVYVLAIDFSVVSEGVKSKYGSEIDPKKAQKFFDKIIQVPFCLPVSQYNFKNYISNFVPDAPKEQSDKYYNIIQVLLDQNPRSIKRAFNQLSLYKSIMNRELSNEEYSLNLFTMLLFQNKNEAAYNTLLSAYAQSTDQFAELKNSQEYQQLFNLLRQNITSFKDYAIDDNEYEEHLYSFFSFMMEASKLSVNTISDPSESPIERQPLSETNAHIISKLRSDLIQKRINNDSIYFFDDQDLKHCCFRIKENDLLNLVVYALSDAPITPPSNANIKRKNTFKKDTLPPSDVIVYNQSSSLITFVGINRCKNEALIDELLTYYQLN